MSLWSAVKALWRHDLPLADQVDALTRRLAAVEAALRDVAEVVESEAHREAKWQDQQLQLRKLLGRLDAHAGKERAANGAASIDPKQLAAVIRSKYPTSG